MAAADDQAAHYAAPCQRHAAAPRTFPRVRQRKSQAGVQNSQREIGLVIHCPVEPVQPLHRGRHSLHEGEQQQDCQRQRQILLRRFQPLHDQPRTGVQAQEERQQHANKRQAIPLVAENTGLQRQHKAGDIQPLPVVEIVNGGLPRGLQQTHQVESILLHHRMGARRIDIVVRRRPRIERQYDRRQQKDQHHRQKTAPPALLHPCIMPKVHTVIPSGPAAYGFPRICCRK